MSLVMLRYGLLSVAMGPTLTAMVAWATNSAEASTSVYTTTVSTFICWQVRTMRSAISPRLAIITRRMGLGPFGAMKSGLPSTVGGFGGSSFDMVCLVETRCVLFRECPAIDCDLRLNE